MISFLSPTTHSSTGGEEGGEGEVISAVRDLGEEETGLGVAMVHRRPQLEEEMRSGRKPINLSLSLSSYYILSAVNKKTNNS